MSMLAEFAGPQYGGLRGTWSGCIALSRSQSELGGKSIYCGFCFGYTRGDSNCRRGVRPRGLIELFRLR